MRGPAPPTGCLSRGATHRAGAGHAPQRASVRHGLGLTAHGLTYGPGKNRK